MKVEGLSTSPHLSVGLILGALNPSYTPKFLKYLFNIIVKLCFLITYFQTT